jgi:hypothetical protein
MGALKKKEAVMTCIKTCKRCGVMKDASDFYGKQPECKLCMSLRMKDYYKRNKQAICDRTRAYSKGLRDDADAYRRLQAQWRKDDGDDV